MPLAHDFYWLWSFAKAYVGPTNGNVLLCAWRRLSSDGEYMRPIIKSRRISLAKSLHLTCYDFPWCVKHPARSPPPVENSARDKKQKAAQTLSKTFTKLKLWLHVQFLHAIILESGRGYSCQSMCGVRDQATLCDCDVIFTINKSSQQQWSDRTMSVYTVFNLGLPTWPVGLGELKSEKGSTSTQVVHVATDSEGPVTRSIFRRHPINFWNQVTNAQRKGDQALSLQSVFHLIPWAP